MFDENSYESAVNEWFAKLKDVVTNEDLIDHLKAYPEKSDFIFDEAEEPVEESEEYDKSSSRSKE